MEHSLQLVGTKFNIPEKVLSVNTKYNVFIIYIIYIYIIHKVIINLSVYTNIISKTLNSFENIIFHNLMLLRKKIE